MTDVASTTQPESLGVEASPHSVQFDVETRRGHALESSTKLRFLGSCATPCRRVLQARNLMWDFTIQTQAKHDRPNRRRAPLRRWEHAMTSRSIPSQALRLVGCVGVLLFATSCANDASSPMQPSAQTLYTTPTGLVTANPPQSFHRRRGYRRVRHKQRRIDGPDYRHDSRQGVRAGRQRIRQRHDDRV